MFAPLTKSQISELEFNPVRPLVICDVDEVVMHFLRGLEEYLDENGLWLDPVSFALNGNIKYKDSHTPLPASEIGGTLEQFFSEKVGSLEPIDGAAEALAEFSEHADVIMLTNMPDAYRGDRIENLHDHGMVYPVVSNSGPKGPSVRHIAEMIEKPVVFIDDTPSNVDSVVEHASSVDVLHFMQDQRFRRFLPEMTQIIASVDNWDDGTHHVLQAVTEQL